METAALRMVLNRNNTITAVPGIQVGHAQDLEALTGCTVIICKTGAVAGVDQRGGAPGTRETDLLRPLHLVQQVQAVLLTGGSAFGLAAADGVVQWLEEHNFGFETGVERVVLVVVLGDDGRTRRVPDLREEIAVRFVAAGGGEREVGGMELGDAVPEERKE